LNALDVGVFANADQARIVSRIASLVASEGRRSSDAGNRAEIAEKQGMAAPKYYVFVMPP